MNSFSSKLITVLASILLLAYIIVQVATLLYNPYETEIVRNGIYEQDILLEGYFVRNEKSLEEQKNGVISYYFEDGEKVPNNAVIADVFQSEKELLNVKFLQRLDVEKNILENSSLKSGETPKLNVLNKDIRLLFTDLLLEIQSEDFTDLVNINDQLIYKLNRASVCIDSSINFNDSINEINNQITSLAASRSQSSHQVISNSSGYFASFVDGFEGLSYQNSTVDSILNTIDILKKSSNSKSNSIGKVLSDSEWRFLGIVDASKAEYFKPDKYFKMSLGPKSEPIKVRVEKIIDSSDTGKIG
ncbi:MAG: HlyD family efflux transporter periplasmic adaptor subunit, partial [Oscillospiraceae bacterium]